MRKIKKSDLIQISYQEFGQTMNVLMKKIRNFQRKNGIKFDLMVPILRSGAFTGFHIAARLDVKTILPVFYMYLNGKIIKRIETSKVLTSVPKRANILVTDSNTTTGKTIALVAREISKIYPGSKLYLAIAWIDQSIKEIPLINKIFYGKKTNEEGLISDKEAKKRGCLNGVIVAPWEDLEIDWREINK